MSRVVPALIVLLAAAWAPLPGRDERFSPAADAAADALRQQILVAAAGPDAPDWAGDYYEGDGLDMNVTLRLAPEAGFLFEWRACMGLCDRNWGTVEMVAGRLRLQFTHENRRDGYFGIAPELILVRWGERHYLIPADDVAGFCFAVNAGIEPRDDLHGGNLLRRGDEAKPVHGWPDVPDWARCFLLPRPVDATVIEVGEPATLSGYHGLRQTPVTLDAGQVEGLRAGMMLFVESDRIAEWVKLTGVEAHRANGLLTQFDGSAPIPRPGWCTSTLAPWKSHAAR